MRSRLMALACSAGSIVALVLGIAGCTDAQAEPLRRQSTTEQVEQDPVLEKARALREAAQAALDAHDLATARTHSTEAIDLLTRADDAGSESRIRVDELSALGKIAHDAGELDAAQRAKTVVVDVLTKTLSDDHPDLQIVRGSLARTLAMRGNLAGARSLQEKVIQVLERAVPADDPELLTARGNLAATMSLQGDLVGARALEEHVLERLSRSVSADDMRLQTARSNLAKTLFALRDYPRARALQEEVLAVLSRTLPDDSLRLQSARGSLARTLFRQGDLAGARGLQETVLRTLARQLPNDHPTLLAEQGSFAANLRAQGDLLGARALQEKVLAGLTKALHADHPALQTARSNLASTLKAMGDLSGARSLNEAALGVLTRQLPKDHPDLQLVRGNLAVTMLAQGDIAGARALSEGVLNVYSATLPDDHSSTQWARANLALARAAQGDFEGARLLQEKALEVFERTLPDGHPDRLNACARLAVTLGSQGEFSAARALLEDVLGTRERSLPHEHPEVQFVRRQLIHTIAGEVVKARHLGVELDPELVRRARDLAMDFVEGHREAMSNEVVVGSLREVEERSFASGDQVRVVLSCVRVGGILESSAEVMARAFVLGESARGAGLAAARLMRKAAGDVVGARLRTERQAAAEALAALGRSGTSSVEFEAARSRCDEATRALIAHAQGRQLVSSEFVGFDELQLAKRLDSRSCAVAYRRYTDRRVEVVAADEEGSPDRVRSVAGDRICAFVVHALDRDAPPNAKSTLSVIDLGPLEPIEIAVDDYRSSIGVGLDRGRSVAVDSIETVRRAGTALRALIFDPLLPAIGDARRLIVVLDDILHLVPIDALPDTAGEGVLGDRWRIEARASLTEMLDGSPHRRGGTLLALGGPAFNREPRSHGGNAMAVVEAASEHPTVVSGILRGGAFELGFQPLPYTADEVRGVGALFGEMVAEHPAIVLEKAEASRAALIELAPTAAFIHIATHGWYAPESIRSWVDDDPIDREFGLELRMSAEEKVRGMSPMLLCGLALAGANLPEDALGRAHGLITAEEIAALDLSNCELAVLSACDTNVGVRRAGQGVASLQRAFQMAGARSVITSLWKVRDEPTKDLMLDFYRRLWVDEKPKHQALREAKQSMRNAKDDEGRPLYSTRDWAGWVLTGEPD
ncbi:MAG: CHAT domain-containing protein [Planctomycetes bacterium]|nr:CHAT domain-containing protein [Planctomycetota bacterium]